MWNEYYTVRDLDEAVALLDEYRERARIVAGGTDMLIEKERGARAEVEALIDITRVPNLDMITVMAGRVRLGPLVTHNHVVGDVRMAEVALPLVQACWEVGAPQIRNRATIAGNLITASPANDSITPLMALGAEIHLRSVRGDRVVPIEDFYTGFRQTAMQSDELLTAIEFPALGDDQAAAFYKLGLRRAQAISVVNATVILTRDGDTVTDAQITLGSVAPTIIRVPDAEAALVGQVLTDETIRVAARAAADTPTPIDDVRGTAVYRTEMVAVLVARLLRRCAANEHTSVKPWGNAPAMLWGEQRGTVSVPLVEGFHHNEDTVIETRINGEQVTIPTGQDVTLLDFLRDHAGLRGSKVGCSEGECGACTIFLDGAAV
ncbi:MAG: FAD binding domain-containing protein, partial [Chloroflexota bacterium]